MVFYLRLGLSQDLMLWLVRGDADQFQKEEAAHGGDNIDWPDPHGGACDADCSDEQPRR